MKKLLIAVMFGFLLVGCGTVESSVDLENKKEMTSEDVVYLLAKIENADYFSKAMDRFSETLSNATYTEDWFYDLGISLGILEGLIEEARKMEPTDKFKPSHEYYIKAIDELEVVVEELPNAIANGDGNKINELFEKMTKSNEYLTISTEKFVAIKTEYGYDE